MELADLLRLRDTRELFAEQPRPEGMTVAERQGASASSPDFVALVEALSETRAIEGALLERLRVELDLSDESEWSRFPLDRLVRGLAQLDYPRRRPRQ